MKTIKLLTVVGTRPNFIKITQLDKVLAKHPQSFEHVLVHTGQHYDYNMSDVFFQQLQIRKPDHFLQVPSAHPAAQMGHMMVALDAILDVEKPDLVLVVGDVNSTFAAAFTAYKKDIPVAHIESGLRSDDRGMPEEINRILTDEIAQYFFITEQSGYERLKAAGKSEDVLFQVGNTMIDTLVAFDSEIQQSTITNDLGIQNEPFLLMTLHRPSNVDDLENLRLIEKLVNDLADTIKIVFPIHPRTKKRMESLGFEHSILKAPHVLVTEPLDYFSFQKLILDAAVILTDSGGIQEETTFRKVPCLTLRKNTERPSTITLGTNELLPFNTQLIVQKIESVLQGTFKKGVIPPGWDGKATERIVDAIYHIFKA